MDIVLLYFFQENKNMSKKEKFKRYTVYIVLDKEYEEYKYEKIFHTNSKKVAENYYKNLIKKLKNGE